jgi:lysozyme
VSAFFDYLRRKKQEWSKNPKARLTQREVDEANGVLNPPAVDKELSVASKQIGSKLGPLAAIVGSVAASSLLLTVPLHEGTSYKAYRDIAGIWTICQGDTKNVKAGLVETPEGCRARLERQLVIHAKGVMACTPRLAEEGHDWQRAAAVSLAYNIGVGAYCKSSIDKRFDAGLWKQGCNNFILYNKARVNGVLRVVKGLDTRRKDEIRICLKGLA